MTPFDSAKSGSGMLTASANAVMHQQEALAGVHCDENLINERGRADCTAENLQQNLCVPYNSTTLQHQSFTSSNCTGVQARLTIWNLLLITIVNTGAPPVVTLWHCIIAVPVII